MKLTNETVKRAAKTFFQAVVAYILISLKNGVDFTDFDAVKAFALGVIAAGLAALMNLEKRKVGGEGNGVYYYNQNDYNNIPYNKPDGTKKTVKTSGCGVVSACIALNTLAGMELYSVEEMAALSKKCGARINNGTDENRLLSYLCKKNKSFSFKCSRDIDALCAHLKNGGVAICNQGDSYNVFSTSGHYVVAYKYENGGIFVADPSNTNNKYNLYNRPERIIKKTSLGCVVKPLQMKKATADRYPSFYLISCVEKKKYFKKCKESETSLVDGLKSVGADSSFKYRKSIAKANSIKAYTGTAKQNTALLNLLKKNRLIIP